MNGAPAIRSSKLKGQRTRSARTGVCSTARTMARTGWVREVPTRMARLRAPVLDSLVFQQLPSSAGLLTVEGTLHTEPADWRLCRR